MKNNFFNKSIGNINSRPFLNSEVTSQILYGEKFKILSKNKGWVKIKTRYDNYTGFIKSHKFLKKFKPTNKVYKLRSRIFSFRFGKNTTLLFKSLNLVQSTNKNSLSLLSVSNLLSSGIGGFCSPIIL